MNRTIRKLALGAGGLSAAGAAMLALAGPAAASGTPVNVSATVSQSVTLSGITGSISLSGAPGTTVTDSSAEAYTVASNDGAGYSVTVTPSGSTMTSGGNSIPNALLSVKTNAGAAQPFSGATALTTASVSSVSGASGDSYADTWALQIPANQASVTYAESFTYLVVGK